MYRVYYRLLSSQLNPRFKLIPTSRDETVRLHIEAEQSKTFTPKRLKWHEITIPDEFQIDNPHPLRDIERNEVSQIIEEPDGNVLIRFNSMREHASSSTIQPGRHSFAHSRRCSFAESSEQSFRMPTSIHVHHTVPIPAVSTSPPLSPTASQMKDHDPEDFQDFSSTDEDQKELIFDIIQDLPPEAQKRQLEKLKALILREESSSARLVEPFSISKMFDRYPHMNPQIRQHSTKELQTEINSLKAQVKELKERVFSIETKNLELDTQIALLQAHILPPIPYLGFQTWMNKMTGPRYILPISFHAELRVPWIFCWSYKIDQLHSHMPDFPFSLIREFKIKWWTGYSVDFCSQETVLNFIHTGQKIQKTIQQLPKQATTPTSTVKIQPSHNAESSLSKITTDDEAQFQEFLRFKAFQKQLTQRASQSPTSSQDSSTDPFGGPCAQDPFDI
ncbi:hypothetical protein M9H77_36226 [Catharanthus roseus]|uniref:Uncharacterized protein n=1 Tax=Catharanthus roseus TaxID=4058 RepID=A0ACB9ZSI1_CATRO|nr:hypothetical protein M9H77_36226 [Catharanthus roseus]